MQSCLRILRCINCRRGRIVRMEDKCFIAVFHGHSWNSRAYTGCAWYNFDPVTSGQTVLFSMRCTTMCPAHKPFRAPGFTRWQPIYRDLTSCSWSIYRLDLSSEFYYGGVQFGVFPPPGLHWSPRLLAAISPTDPISDLLLQWPLCVWRYRKKSIILWNHFYWI